MRDIVLPKDNEEEFINIALKLGLKKLYFLYDFDKYQSQKPKIFDFDVEIGFIVNQRNINNASKQSNLLVVKSSDKDRMFIENKKIKLIYALEENHKIDYLHQRASGLNQIICELANKNGIAIGFPYGSLLDNNVAISSLLIGRMMQNIALCQKYKVKTVIGSFSEKPIYIRSSHDIKSLFTSLGMDGSNIVNSLNDHRHKLLYERFI